MSRFLFAALAFVVLFSVATATECPENEVYLECGTACPPTCARPLPATCINECVEGCFCEGGLLRNSDGECVPRDQCGCEDVDY